MDFALKATPSIWWVAHKQYILDWPRCRKLMEIWFGEKISYTGQKCTWLTNPIEHIEYCRATGEAWSWEEWVHHFVHTLDMIPRHCYTSVELQRGTLEWDELAARFTRTFKFVDDHPSIVVALQVIKMKMFEDIPMLMSNFNHSSTTVQH